MSWAPTSVPVSDRRSSCSAGDWQAAESLGAWTLVGCTVSPGFRFEGFELAEPDWEPGR